ncbi:MAG TPA: hypothetical protein VMB25_20145 [Bryobacteraceae bacterium]|nr:hypothetical protein [Bryobacteraceae bacterium]
MTRCNSCNGILTRTDVECYVCGEPVPGARKRARRTPAAKLEPGQAPAKPASPLNNLLLLGSLALAAYCYYAGLKMPLALSLGLSVALLSMRFLDGRVAHKDPSQHCP